MANIPGANNALPGVFTDVVTVARGISVPGGTRIPAIVGEGSTDQILVSTANGGGSDGFNETYTSTSGADGRHFIISNAPLVENRTRVFKNGIPLTGKEEVIDTLPFDNRYDYRLETSTGKLELQRAHIADQGGADFIPLSTNVGLGSITNLSLEDDNAPSERWTIRCVGVQRDVGNTPVPGTAKFMAFGSVSGALLDANANPIIWVADGYEVSNGILSFAIEETSVMSVVTSPFREGDAFTIVVNSGVLSRGDTLTVNSISYSFLNDPVYVDDKNALYARSGSPSLTNTLSLGGQLAFSNAAPVMLAVQAAPSMPRRTSYVLAETVDTDSSNDDDFIFPLPLGVVPDFDSNIHFFITNNATNVETQILPNKFEYYLLDEPGQPTTNQFITDNTSPPGGYSYSYTVKEAPASIATGFDGYIGRDLSTFDEGVFSSSITFNATHVGKTLKIIDSLNSGNLGSFTVNSVSNGKLYVTKDSMSDFVSGTGVAFQVINPTTNLPVVGGSGTDGVLTANIGLATATLTSVAIDFSSLGTPTDLRLKINGSSDDNNGLYDITSYNSGTDELTLTKVIVNESAMRYEVVDPTDTSVFVVLNKNVVPANHGLRITIIDDRDASFYDAGWLNALESLEAYECDMLSVLPTQTISVIFQNALAHCKSMSNIENKKERILLIGGIRGLTPDNVTGLKPAAVEDIGVLEGIQGDSVTEVLAGNVEDLADYSVSSAFGSTYRCVYFFPDEIIVQAGTENAYVDGMYLAAAACGYFAADLRIENPLTNKVLSGFTIPRSKLYSNRVKKALVQAGVCVMQPVSGGGKCVRGITTTQSGYLEEQEISIVFIRDRVSKTLRGSFEGFIGTPEDGELTRTQIGIQAGITLDSLISNRIITKYADLNVYQDTVDPTQWDIEVAVRPRYAINFIYIRVSLGNI